MKSAMNKSPSAARQNLVRVSPGVYRNAGGELVGPRGRTLPQQNMGGQGQQNVQQQAMSQQLQALGMQQGMGGAREQAINDQMQNLVNAGPITAYSMPPAAGHAIQNLSADKMLRNAPNQFSMNRQVAQNLQQLRSGQGQGGMTMEQMRNFMASNPNAAQNGLANMQQQYAQAQQIQQNLNPVQPGTAQGNFMGYRRPGNRS